MKKIVKIVCGDKVIDSYEIPSINFRFPEKGFNINVKGDDYIYEEGSAVHGKNNEVIINIFVKEKGVPHEENNK